MEISNNYYATISFRGMCTVQEMMTFQYFDIFLYETFSLIFGLGLDFGSASCDSKLLLSSYIFDYILAFNLVKNSKLVKGKCHNIDLIVAMTENVV